MRFRRKRRHDPEIAPDEIFLDASNAPKFDRNQFEGRLEKPLSKSTFTLIYTLLGILFIILIIRTFQLEVINGSAFAVQSARNSLTAEVLFAPRGVIKDRNGTILAENIELADGNVRRHYSIPSMGQIIGYVSYPKKDAKGRYYDITQNGLAGIEAAYNKQLTGTNGKVLVERDALGRIRSQGTIDPAQAGQTVTLSIDAHLEKLFAKAVSDVVKNKGFIAGAGVIVDIRTGEVRALVSFPTYDPNVMSSGGPAKTIMKYNTEVGHPFLNHAVQGIYTPGSIVKPFVAAGALTDGIITPRTIIDDTGKLSVPDPYHPGKSFVYTGWKALGLVDVYRAIAWSSDIFFYTVGGGFGSQKGLGIDRLDYWYRAFGLGTATGIGLPGEASGVIPDPAWKKKVFGAPWYLGDTYFTAIGQYSMQVTPIQMAVATAAIANGGYLCTPTLISGKKPSCTKVPVDASALKVVQEGMRQGVTGALAQAINLPYVSVAAKTGTAQVGVRNQFDNSWVEGFFPYKNPQYAFSVVLERGPSGTGERAVNVMQDLFQALYASRSVYTNNAGTTTPIQ